jgi:hypothetical protein
VEIVRFTAIGGDLEVDRSKAKPQQ